MRPVFLAIPPLALLCQCQSPVLGRAEGIDPNPFQVLEKQARPENRDPKRVAVPMLKSPSLEKRWGAPKLLVGPKGGYALRYRNPRNSAIHLTIFGSPDIYPVAGMFPPPYTDLGMDPRTGTYNPREVAQGWQTSHISGRGVRFFITEASSPGAPLQYSTETFRLSGPGGRTASYRLRTSSARGAEDARSLFETATF